TRRASRTRRGTKRCTATAAVTAVATTAIHIEPDITGPPSLHQMFPGRAPRLDPWSTGRRSTTRTGWLPPQGGPPALRQVTGRTRGSDHLEQSTPTGQSTAEQRPHGR